MTNMEALRNSPRNAITVTSRAQVCVYRKTTVSRAPMDLQIFGDDKTLNRSVLIYTYVLLFFFFFLQVPVLSQCVNMLCVV